MIRPLTLLLPAHGGVPDSFTPAKEKCAHEGVFVGGLDGERCQSHRYRQGDVITDGTRDDCCSDKLLASCGIVRLHQRYIVVSLARDTNPVVYRQGL
jgi:hypothetical protein